MESTWIRRADPFGRRRLDQNRESENEVQRDCWIEFS